VYDVPGVRRLQAAAVSDVQREQEIRTPKSLHRRDDRPEVHELRRSGTGAMLRLLNDATKRKKETSSTIDGARACVATVVVVEHNTIVLLKLYYYAYVRAYAVVICQRLGSVIFVLVFDIHERATITDATISRFRFLRKTIQQTIILFTAYAKRVHV